MSVSTTLGPIHGPLRSERPCRFSDCWSPVGRSGARGYCYKHYVRVKLWGDPLFRNYHGNSRAAGEPCLSGPDHGNWRDDASYGAAHDHLRRVRGLAAEHECVGCGGQAAQWAYDYTDRSPLVDLRGCVYSRDVARYRPMCPSCHKLHDLAHAEGVSA